MLLPTTEIMYCPASNHEPSITGTFVLVMQRMMSTSFATISGASTALTGTLVLALIFLANPSR